MPCPICNKATDATYTESAMAFMTPPRPFELDALRQRGAKLLLYHGVSDAIFSVTDTDGGSLTESLSIMEEMVKIDSSTRYGKQGTQVIESLKKDIEKSKP